MRCKRVTYGLPLVEDEESEQDTSSLNSVSSESEENGYSANAYVPSFEEIVAMNEANARLEQRDREKQDRTRKRIRETAARENRELTQDVDFTAGQEDDEEVGEINPAKKNSARRRSSKKPDEENEEIDFHKEFTKIGFTHPFYPHTATMESLGIKDDVMQLLKGCGIDKFVTKVYPAYPKAAAEFLATLMVKDFRDSPTLFEKFGGVLITFDFEGKQKSLDFNEINELFGFSPGEPKQHNVNKEDMNLAWRLMTGEKVLPTQPKATAIRHPAISYARKVIAKTFFCRFDPGNINTSDMQFLTIAFAEEFGFEEPLHLQGDRAGAGLAFVLCKFLENIKGRVSACIKKGHKYEELTVGGIITGLLKKADLPLDEAEQVPPKFMDIDYLHTHSILTGPREQSKFYYKFHQKGNQVAVVELPNEGITTLDKPENMRFKPPASALIDPATLGSTRTPVTAKRTETPGQPQQKRDPPVKRVAATPCICTTEKFREKLVAELTPQITRAVETNLWDLMQVEVNQKIKDGIEKGLAELRKTLGKKPEIPENSARRERVPERQVGETTPAPTRRPDRDHERTPRTTTADPSRQRPPARTNHPRPPPPPPRRT